MLESNIDPKASGKIRQIVAAIIEGYGFTTAKAGIDNVREIAAKLFPLPRIRTEDNPILLSDAANLFPFVGSTLSYEDLSTPIHLGTIDPSGEPFILDDRGLKLQNRNIGCFSSPGGGKTTFGINYTMTVSLLGENAVIFDPEGEYRELVKEMDGVEIILGYSATGAPFSANLLGLYGIPLPERVRQLRVLLGFTQKIEGFSEARLQSYLLETYSRFGIIADDPSTWDKEPPTLNDLLETVENALKRMDRRDAALWNAVSILKEKIGDIIIEYPFFNCRGTLSTSVFDSRVVSFNFHGLHTEDAKRFCGLALMQIVRGQFYRLQRHLNIVIDECWMFLNTVLVSIVRAARKADASVLLLTQSLPEITKGAEEILNDLAVKIILRTEMVSDIARILKLPKHVQDEVPRLSRGFGYIGIGSVWIRLKLEGDMRPPSLKPGTGEPAPVQTRKAFIRLPKLTGGTTVYYYDPSQVANPEHEGTVKMIVEYLREKGVHCTTSLTREPDIEFILTKELKRVAIEVETGSHSPARLQEKIDRIHQLYAHVLIVADSPVKARYVSQLKLPSNCELLNRSELVRRIDSLLLLNTEVKKVGL